MKFGILSFLLVLLISPMARPSAVLYVPDDFATIQAAIDAAQEGDRIVVRPGTYFENIDFLGKDVCLKSERGPEATILDGGFPQDPNRGAVVTFAGGEGSGAVLEGFTITNGTGNYYSGSLRVGGGISINNGSFPVIKGNIITGNRSGEGGGVDCDLESSPLIKNNRIENNTAAVGVGGGIHVGGYSAPRITENTITGNLSMMTDGGGIGSWYGAPQIEGNVVTGNFAMSEGGGILFTGQLDGAISFNIVSDNEAYRGGGIACNMTDKVVVRGNVVEDNRAVEGAGIFCGFGVSAIENNLLRGNVSSSSGGGIELQGEASLLSGNTVYGNSAAVRGGGLVCAYNDATAVNSIFWGNEAPTGAEIFVGNVYGSYPPRLRISYCDVQGGRDGAGIGPGGSIDQGAGLIDADPLFLDPFSGDFHLRQEPPQPGYFSPCVDAGDPTSNTIDGTTRSDGAPDEGVVDLGYHYPFPKEIRVPGDFPAIQEAIDKAAEGGVIVVGPGTYYENIDFKGKALTVRSERGPKVTVIDGRQRGSVVVFANGEGPDTLLEGFTITNGNGETLGAGGGIDCRGSSPSISGNVITKNAGSNGGGIYCFDASPLITGNAITDNSAMTGAYGGGIYCLNSSPAIENNRILRNETYISGGGIEVMTGSPVISGNVIGENEGRVGGGGISLGNGEPRVSGNVIRGNRANDGAGIYISGCNRGAFDGNILFNNRSSGTHATGGAIYCMNASPKITNCMIFANMAADRAGALFFYISQPVIAGVTIYGNKAGEGGGIYSKDSILTVTNSILWNNRSIQWGIESELTVVLENGAHSIVRIDHSDVAGIPQSVSVGAGASVEQGPGIISDDPLFVDPAGSDFHLTAGSPCRNAGGNGILPLAAEDFEGDPRAAEGVADIGADELYPHLYYIGDAHPGGNITVRIAGLPGAGATLVLGSGFLSIPMSTPYGFLFLRGPFRSVFLGKIPASGILAHSGRVPNAWVPGETHYFQAFTGGMLTNLMTLEVR